MTKILTPKEKKELDERTKYLELRKQTEKKRNKFWK